MTVEAEPARRGGGEQFATCGLCERQGACFYPHLPGERFECNLVIVAMMNSLERVAGRLEQLLGARCVTGACRATLQKSSLVALFVLAPMGPHEALHLVAHDRFLEPALVRVMLVDSAQPPLGSLDEVVASVAARMAAEHSDAVEPLTIADDTLYWLRVRTLGGDLELQVLEALRRAWTAEAPWGLDKKACTHVVDVLVSWGHYYVGVWVLPSANRQAPTPSEYWVAQMNMAGKARPGKPEIPQHPKLPPLTEPICRAFFKLEEAIERAGVPLRSDWLCVDVGSSPGGWTQSLARRLKLASLTEAEAEEAGGVNPNPDQQRGHVWAVDPGVLEAEAHGTNVTRVPMIAQEAVEALQVGGAM